MCATAGPGRCAAAAAKLVTGWFTMPPAGWEEWLQRFDPAQYGGFNLVLGEPCSGAGPGSNRSPNPWRRYGTVPGLPFACRRAGMDASAGAVRPRRRARCLAQDRRAQAALQQHLDEGARPLSFDPPARGGAAAHDGCPRRATCPPPRAWRWRSSVGSSPFVHLRPRWLSAPAAACWRPCLLGRQAAAAKNGPHDPGPSARGSMDPAAGPCRVSTAANGDRLPPDLQSVKLGTIAGFPPDRHRSAGRHIRSPFHAPCSSPVELLSPARDADIASRPSTTAPTPFTSAAPFGCPRTAPEQSCRTSRLVRFAHRYHNRIFVTLNTILRDDRLDAAAR